MENYLYREFNRSVYRETLANGLRVELMPMAGFNKTYAIMTTDFGSVDNHFIPYQGDEAVRVPDGTAHFLEHKLFEKQDHDAFDLFGELGGRRERLYQFYPDQLPLFDDEPPAREHRRPPRLCAGALLYGADGGKGTGNYRAGNSNVQ